MRQPPSVPGPDDSDSLSDWEREVLAGIEDDLATSDPRLAEAMAGAAAGWRPLSWLWILALVVGLLVLVIGCVLVLGPSWGRSACSSQWSGQHRF